MGSEDRNGVLVQLKHIEQDVHEIKDDLGKNIQELSSAIRALTSKFDNFIIVAQNSIPIRAVFWLMGIMILGLVGIEGIKQIGPLLNHIFKLGAI